MINWTFRKLTISTLIKVTIYIHGCWNFILNTLYTWRCCHGYRFTIHGRLGEEDPQHEVLLVRGYWYVRKRTVEAVHVTIPSITVQDHHINVGITNSSASYS